MGEENQKNVVNTSGGFQEVLKNVFFLLPRAPDLGEERAPHTPSLSVEQVSNNMGEPHRNTEQPNEKANLLCFHVENTCQSETLAPNLGPSESCAERENTR